jgi:hypothetical protein
MQRPTAETVANPIGGRRTIPARRRGAASFASASGGSSSARRNPTDTSEFNLAVDDRV